MEEGDVITFLKNFLKSFRSPPVIEIIGIFFNVINYLVYAFAYAGRMG